jgi:GAF domain-containing protein
VRVSLRELARSLGALGDLDTADGADQALYQAVDGARLLLGADTAGLLLADADGQLRWAIAVDPRAQSAGVVQERLAVGPCVEAFEEARAVAVFDVAADRRWTPVRHELAAAGIGACLSVPVVLAGGPVGVLDLYTIAPRLWDDSQMAAAHAYAGILSLLLGAALTASVAGELAEQLQHALTVRIQVEQAKGVLMARYQLGERAAWERLRGRARRRRRTVSAIARELLAEFGPEPDQLPGRAAGRGQNLATGSSHASITQPTHDQPAVTTVAGTEAAPDPAGAEGRGAAGG